MNIQKTIPSLYENTNRAIITGQKTVYLRPVMKGPTPMTRRRMNFYYKKGKWREPEYYVNEKILYDELTIRPVFSIGQIVAVAEPWKRWGRYNEIIYKYHNDDFSRKELLELPWYQERFMLKKNARILVKIKSIGLCFLWDVPENIAKKTGIIRNRSTGLYALQTHELGDATIFTRTAKEALMIDWKINKFPKYKKNVMVWIFTFKLESTIVEKLEKI